MATTSTAAPTASSRVTRVAWLQLAATVVLFGITWPVLKIGLEASSPVWLAAGRASVGTLTAFVILAVLGRLALPHRDDWPVILSVGGLQLTCFFALANLGVQNLPAGRSGVLAYTTMLWMVPLSMLAGERVGVRAISGALLGVLGIVVLADPQRFDWHDRRIVLGHVYLLLAGFSWAVAMLHIRHHEWRNTPLDALPWQMGFAAILLWILAILLEPGGHLDLDRWELWTTLFYVGVVAGPTATWAAVSVTRTLPPITTSLGMLGVPLLGIATSVWLLGEPVTWPLAIGTLLVLGGMAIVILDGRAK
jgi:drug/metabolite transporter (DMT)-like permease